MTRRRVGPDCGRIRPEERVLEVENSLDQLEWALLRGGADASQLKSDGKVVQRIAPVRQVQPFQLVQKIVQLRQAATAFGPDR